MENKLNGQLLLVKATIYTNKQATYEIKQDFDDIKKKLNKYYFGFYDIKALINKVLGQNKTYLPYNMDSSKSQEPY